MATLASPQAAATSNGEKSHAYTCNSCLVAYRTGELQRAHMQTDFHRYNLKRRVASLPPLTLEVFTEKVLANRADQAATAAKASFEKICSACQKTYFSQNAYANHLNSQKHKINVAAKSRLAARNGTEIDDSESVMSSAFSLGDSVATIGTPKEEKNNAAEEEFKDVVDGMKDVSLEEPDLSRRPSRPHHSGQDDRTEHPLSRTATASSKSAPDTPASMSVDGDKPPLQDCLFCNYTSPTVPLNATHMQRHHGLFIPEQDYLIDLDGLIGYFYNQIAGEHRCLYCPKVLHTTSGIQTHMRDLGHCMINFEAPEDAIEMGEFYDFSSTWDDAGNESDSSTSTEAGGVTVPKKKKERRPVGSGGDEEDEGWETDSTLSDVPSDEITSVPISDRSHSHAHATPNAVYHDDYELHLPTGRTAGHRSLNKYFKQNLRNYPTPAERMAQRAITGGSDSDEEMEDGDNTQVADRGRGREANRQLATRANGGLGMAGVSDVLKKQVKAEEKRARKTAQRRENNYKAGNEKQHNFQKHFRDPLLQ